MDPPAGVSGAPNENDIMKWNAVIFGYERHAARALVDPDEAPQGCLQPTCLIGPRAPLRRGVRRPADTPFEDGTFKLTLQFQEDYPNKPPTVRFVSAMFHPNGTA